MRQKLYLASLFLIGLIASCSNPDSFSEGDPCGPNGECPQGYECETSSSRCFRKGGTGADAGVAKADAAALLPDAVPDAAPQAADAAAPTVMLVKTPAARTRDTVLSFEFSGTPSGVAFQCRLDQAAYAPCTSPASVTTVEGEHSFSVIATAGGQSSAAASFAFTVDTTGPPAAIDSGPTTVSGPSAAFTYSAEPGSRFECAFDPAGTGSFASCPAAGVSYADLVNGQSYTFRVRALDDLGNPGAPAIRTFTADTVAPAVIISSPMMNATTGTMVAIALTADPPEPGVAFECDLGKGFTACVSGGTLTYPEGPAMLSVRTRDRVNNIGPVSSVSFVVSTAKTTVGISAPAADALLKATVTVTLVVTNAVSVTCTLDGSSAPCTPAGATLGPLPDGKHTFSVVAHGAGGDSPPATVSFTTDGTAPEIGVTLAGAADDSGLATFTLTPSEKLAALEATIDGSPCVVSSSFTLATCSFLSAGTHLFEAVGTDLAGNVGAPGTATATMTYTPGRGHLVVMGFGFHTAGASKTRILGNALAQAPAAGLGGFARPLRLLYYDAGAVDSGEKANVKAAVAAGLGQHGLDYDAAGSEELGARNQLADRLAGKDAFIVYNQGSADLSGVAAAFRLPLGDFLAAGGIVVVTDGWYGPDKLPSQSTRVLDPSLLDVSALSVWPGAFDENPWMVLGSVDADALTAGAGQSFAGSDSDPAVSYLVSDSRAVPIYYTQNIACENFCGVPVVVDKVFPKPARGPVTVTVVSITTGAVPSQIVFQGADGSVQKGPFATNLAGTVVGSVDDGGTVTVAFDPPDSDHPVHVLETVFGARPFDDLKLGLSFSGDNQQQNPPPVGTVQVDLADHKLAIYQAKAAASYQARVICSDSGSSVNVGDLNDCGQGWMSTDLCSSPNDQGSWTLPYYSDCLNGSNKLDIVLEARDATRNVIGMQLLRDVDPTSQTAPKAASWMTATTGPDYTVTLTSPPAGAMGAVISEFFRVGDRFSGEDGGQFAVPFVGPAIFGGISPNNADGAGDLEGVQFTDQSFSVLLHANFSVGLASRTVNLTSELLPRVTFTLGGSATRPTVAHAPAVASADGASAILKWQELDGQAVPTVDHFWGLIFPAGQSPVTVPLLPSALSAYRPGGAMTSPLEIGSGIIIDSTLYADYDDWINQYWFPQALPLDEPSPFTFRAAVFGEGRVYLPFFD